MITRLAHVCLSSTDLDRTENFYTRVLGFKLKYRYFKGGKPFGSYFEISPNQFIEVFLNCPEGDPNKAHVRHFCLETDNIDNLIKTIRSRDWEITDKVVGRDSTLQCWITDPDGTRIEFQQYTAESAQRIGGDRSMD